ncbi:hypothetical protein [Haloferax sp. Q22]|uniref:hypothetical protein n=1 Tax=Haloferax sp. (strain Q22) TaxID=1526048 RepID=UPI0012F96354|nr:hypothetical protein [Haloferax sp. Q22]
MSRTKRFAAATSILFFLLSVSSAAAQPGEAPGDVVPEKPGQQIPENISNTTGQNPLSQIPGLNNNTLPMTIDDSILPENASAVAKSAVNTVSDAVGSAAGSAVDGIGSFLSENLPAIPGLEQSDPPVNGTNSTER